MEQFTSKQRRNYQEEPWSFAPRTARRYGGYEGRPYIDITGIKKLGGNLKESYLPLFSIAFLSGLVILKRDWITGLIGFLGSLGIILYMYSFSKWLIEPNFYELGVSHLEIKFGFYIGFSISIMHFVLLTFNFLHGLLKPIDVPMGSDLLDGQFHQSGKQED